jgi:hypothetical protein
VLEITGVAAHLSVVSRTFARLRSDSLREDLLRPVPPGIQRRSGRVERDLGSDEDDDAGDHEDDRNEPQNEFHGVVIPGFLTRARTSTVPSLTRAS